MKERLQKVLAQAGYGSRRHNEKLIRAGRVRVNGRVATLGDKADADADTVTVDGEAISFEPPIYVMLHKPKGVLSTTEDGLAQGRTTVRDLVDVSGHIYPVGRLDKQSEGLILLTNDGDLAHRLTHPRYEHEKVYRVTVAGAPSPETLRVWRQGVRLDGTMTAPAGIEVIGSDGEHTALRIVLREGRKRQIRRVAAMLGHPVQRLTRTQISTLRLGDLAPGAWRHLAKAEVEALRRSVRKKARM